MGRGTGTTDGSINNTQLLFGKGRSGTRKIRLTKAQYAEQAHAQAVEQYRANGGQVDQDAKGTWWWRTNGELHREGGPAVEYADGSCAWWVNGQLHREGGPAVIGTDRWQLREWWVNGQLHREGGPAHIEYPGPEMTIQMWYQYGQKHREDGPAIESSTEVEVREWWVNGQRHRLDGPAVEGSSALPEWWVNGQQRIHDGHEEDVFLM